MPLKPWFVDLLQWPAHTEDWTRYVRQLQLSMCTVSSKFHGLKRSKV